MPNPVFGMVLSSVGSSLIQSRSAKKAADSQSNAANLGVAEQAAARKEAAAQFQQVRESLAPFIEMGQAATANLSQYQEAGTSALASQMDLAGVNGYKAQQAAIGLIENSSEFTSLVDAGEQGILSNASATGGLRGGNTQGALAQYRPQMLSALIDKQYDRFSGLSAMGQDATNQALATGASAAAGQASASQAASATNQQGASNIANLYGQSGAAQAQASLATGQAIGNTIGGVGRVFGGISSGALAAPEGQNMLGKWGLGF